MKRLFFSSVLLFVLVHPGLARQYALQFSAATAAGDNEIFVGEGRNLMQAGTVFRFEPQADGSWVEVGSLKPSDTSEAADGFGRAIDLDATTLAVGAPVAGVVYVFEKEGESWKESARLDPDVEGFGARLTIRGNTLLVATPGSRQEPARVFAYRRGSTGTWSLAGELMVDGLQAFASFGSSLQLGDRTAAVGAPRGNGLQGIVYLFSEANDGWQLSDSLTYGRAAEGDGFGSSLLLAETHFLVGLPGRDGREGAVAVHVRDQDGKWTLDRDLKPFDAQGGEAFGSTLAMDASHIWIGAPGYGNSEGTVYRFEIDHDQMRTVDVVHVRPQDLQYRSGFGGSLSVHDGTAVVGAIGHDNFEGAAFPAMIEGDRVHLSAPVYSDSGVFESITGDQVDCAEAEASGFPCQDVDMLSFLSRYDLGARRGIQVSDVWGWEHEESGREFAIVGRTDGTSFIELTDPSNPIYLGDLPKTATANQSLWRDMKTYRNYVYIVADGAGAHHMQIFDLTQLLNVTDAPKTFTETNIYKGIYSSHNIVINEESGFAYAVGSDSGGESCGGALHMIDLSDPVNPTFAGCFADTRTGGGRGATHDAQCVTYRGPDTDYAGSEICLSSNGNALSIADVTDKVNPVAISIADYPNVAYTHQGWITDDHRYFYVNDEGDEASGLVEGTRTLIFDLTVLDQPELVNEYIADNNAIDHNLYIDGNLMYQTNYVSGLRILDISNPEAPVEVAHFDTVPYGPNDNSPVLGAWSNYPYFKSGTIVVTSGREGVFFLKKKEIDI